MDDDDHSRIHNSTSNCIIPFLDFSADKCLYGDEDEDQSQQIQTNVQMQQNMSNITSNAVPSFDFSVTEDSLYGDEDEDQVQYTQIDAQISQNNVKDSSAPSHVPARNYPIFLAMMYDSDGQLLPEYYWTRESNNRPVSHPVELELEDPYAISHEQFVEGNEYQTYKCTICLSVARNPWYHPTSTNPICASIFCKKCFDEAISQKITTCPYRCREKETFNSSKPLPFSAPKGQRSIMALNNVLLKCKFPECGQTIKYLNYKRHIQTCSANPSSQINSLCKFCLVPQDGHDCKSFVDEMKKKNEKLLKENEYIRIKLHKTKIELEKTYAKIRALEQRSPICYTIE